DTKISRYSSITALTKPPVFLKLNSLTKQVVNVFLLNFLKMSDFFSKNQGVCCKNTTLLRVLNKTKSFLPVFYLF
ncbi:MAG: hypothetical protein IKX14_00060, partial [Neisseriaceae bacterium]|nr:hypothetical protein [Neisseriaceae bacterium]